MHRGGSTGRDCGRLRPGEHVPSFGTYGVSDSIVGLDDRGRAFADDRSNAREGRTPARSGEDREADMQVRGERSDRHDGKKAAAVASATVQRGGTACCDGAFASADRSSTAARIVGTAGRLGK